MIVYCFLKFFYFGIDVDISASGMPWKELYEYGDRKQTLFTTPFLAQISQVVDAWTTVESRHFCSIFSGIHNNTKTQ